MNKQYENIDFKAFSPDGDSPLSKAETETCIENFYKSAGIHRNGEGGHKTAGRGLRRRFAALLIAAIMMLAFGTIAYASGILRLGVIHHSDGEQEPFLALEDSAQYKAAQEALDYEESFSKEERVVRMEAERNGGFEATGTWNDREKSVTYKGPDEKTRKLLNKYHLEFERVHYYVNSAKKAFDKAGIGNVLGDFWDIDALASSDGNVYDDGYIYTDKGSVTIIGGGESSADPAYWELRVIPHDVYLSPWASFVSSVEKTNDEFTQWDFVTAEGYAAKAISYKESMKDDTEETSEYRNFNVVVHTRGHLVYLGYTVHINDPKHDLSNEEFEKRVDQLDFSALS